MARRTREERKAAKDEAKIRKYASASCAGKSIIEKLQDELDERMREYVEQKQEGLPAQTARGIVRGLAIALAHLTAPYEVAAGVRVIEKGSLKRVRDEEQGGEE